MRVSRGHDDFFQGGVAGPLPDAVDAAFHLTGAGFDGGQTVGHGQAQVVVAVDAERHLFDSRHPVLDVGEQLGEVGRDGVAHGVGDVDGGGPGADYRFQHLVQVLRVGAGGVHGRKLHVVAVSLGPLHHADGHVHDLFPVLPQLVHHVNLRGGQENVDAGGLRHLDGFPSLVNVVGMGAGEGGDDRPPHFAGDVVDGLEIAGGTGGEPGFDDVHPEPFQLPGDFQLFFLGHADAGRLLAVPEGSIQELYSFVSHDFRSFLFLSLLASPGASALRPDKPGTGTQGHAVHRSQPRQDRPAMVNCS